MLQRVIVEQFPDDADWDSVQIIFNYASSATLKLVTKEQHGRTGFKAGLTDHNTSNT
jgi:hypothetical protein